MSLWDQIFSLRTAYTTIALGTALMVLALVFQQLPNLGPTGGFVVILGAICMMGARWRGQG